MTWACGDNEFCLLGRVERENKRTAIHLQDRRTAKEFFTASMFLLSGLFPYFIRGVGVLGRRERPADAVYGGNQKPYYPPGHNTRIRASGVKTYLSQYKVMGYGRIHVHI